MAKVTRRDVVILGAVATAGAVGLRSATAQAPAGRTLTIAARPEAIAIDTAQAAVIVVDMQNDFGAEKACSIARASTSPAFRRL